MLKGHGTNCSLQPCVIGDGGLDRGGAGVGGVLHFPSHCITYTGALQLPLNPERQSIHVDCSLHFISLTVRLETRCSTGLVAKRLVFGRISGYMAE